MISIVENKSIHGHPLEKFEDDGQEMVVILIERRDTKQDELWRHQNVSTKHDWSWKGHSHAQWNKTSPQSLELMIGDYASP